jgi:hypothetical protein
LFSLITIIILLILTFIPWSKENHF